MNKENERKLANAMRKQGHSLSEISKQLQISKSTASVWSKGIAMSALAKKRLNNRTTNKSLEGLKRYSEKVKNYKIEKIIFDTKMGADKLNSLSERDIYCMGLGLYWGEGYKSGSQEFGFTNSDPKMILFYIKWLQVVFKIKKSDLILRISINESHKNREKVVEEFWSNLLIIPSSQFTKISFIKSISKKEYPNNLTYMGTLRVKVSKGTRMRREVIGAIKSINV